MTTTSTTTLVPPPRKKKSSKLRALRTIVVLTSMFLVVGAGLWAVGAAETLGLTQPKSVLSTVRIDKGEVRVFVTESGTLESAKNATVKCMVEAMVGQVGGAQGTMGGNTRGAGGTAPRAGASPSSNGGGGMAPAGGAAAKGTAKSGSAGGAGGAGGAAGSSGASASVRPQIRSFTMQVTPHTPLRGASGGASSTLAKARGGQPAGGNRGGQQMGQEKAGSTRILWLIPEGSRVNKGDLVCELDSAALRDELQSQLIRWEQARSWVDQATEILRVSEISLSEYRDGIYLQDVQQCEKYIEICETQLRQSEVSLKWSKEMSEKGLLSPSQLRAAEYGQEQMQITLDEAKRMRDRLVKFSAPKIIANLEAKIAAVKSDLLAQQGAFQLEEDRKRKLERMIELCTLRAPGAGMVAYAQDSSGPRWAPTATAMQEGVTVRQGQAILMLPDPTKMVVKVSINESKMAQVYTGQRALIRIEAFPDQPLHGTVTEVTAIPASANGPDSGVKYYHANVSIDGGFDGLRTGLSARVSFFVAGKSDVLRIPLQAVRWAAGEPFAAVPKAGESNGFEWRRIELGLVSSSDAEVVSGLKLEDAVIANPDDLPVPPSSLLRTEVGLAPGSDISG